MLLPEFIQILEQLSEARIHTLLIGGGILFLFIAVGGQFGAAILAEHVRRGWAASIGTTLLVFGLLIFLVPNFSSGHEVVGEPSPGEEEPVSRATQTIEPTPREATPIPPTPIPPTFTPAPTATPQLASQISVDPVYFCSGCTSDTRDADMGQGSSRGYILGISAGQTLKVSTNKEASIRVVNPSGNVLLPIVRTPTQQEFYIPSTGNYTIVVGGYGFYTLTFSIPPLQSRNLFRNS